MSNPKMHRRPKSILDLPVEICGRIFKWACTDGGATGCSLALTTKAFKQISKPYRFRSVGVVGLPRLRVLVATLYACAARDRKVEHLSLSDSYSDSGSDEEPDGSENDLEQEQEELLLSVRMLLDMSSRSLRTLYLRLYCSRDFTFTPVNMPLLVGLTIIGSSVRQSEITYVSLPALRSLRIHPFVSTDLTVFKHISTSAPNLEHLTVGGASQDLGLAGIVEVALGLPHICDQFPVGALTNGPLNLKTFTIIPAETPGEEEDDGLGRAIHLQMLSDLKELAVKTDRLKLVLPAEEEDRGSGDEKAPGDLGPAEELLLGSS